MKEAIKTKGVLTCKGLTERARYLLGALVALEVDDYTILTLKKYMQLTGTPLLELAYERMTDDLSKLFRISIDIKIKGGSARLNPFSGTITIDGITKIHFNKYLEEYLKVHNSSWYEFIESDLRNAIYKQR